MVKQFWRMNLIKKFLLNVFPKVDEELSYWVKEVRDFGSKELAHQAMVSIRMKKFHCQGGSIYSLYPKTDTKNMIKLIVALQTISDYLDNLCDRTEVKSEDSFRQLHLAFTDAINPENQIQDYYLLYPYKDDGGYLNKLVETCRQCIIKLPKYNLIKAYALKLGILYSELQIYKHLELNEREQKLIEWGEKNKESYDIANWEFAAASGSTLGIFMLFAAASDKECTETKVEEIVKAYFPWVCGLHILLDYFIDFEEDKEFGDLNFVAHYSDFEEFQHRLSLFIKEAFKNVKGLPWEIFHQTVIQGLLAMYLSDQKALIENQKKTTQVLIREGGSTTVLLWRMCVLLRKRGIL